MRKYYLQVEGEPGREVTRSEALSFWLPDNRAWRIVTLEEK